MGDKAIGGKNDGCKNRENRRDKIGGGRRGREGGGWRRMRRSGNKRGVSRPLINKDKREEKSDTSEREKVRKKGKNGRTKMLISFIYEFTKALLNTYSASAS